jgi:hypothetical protein
MDIPRLQHPSEQHTCSNAPACSVSTNPSGCRLTVRFACTPAAVPSRGLAAVISTSLNVSQTCSHPFHMQPSACTPSGKCGAVDTQVLATACLLLLCLCWCSVLPATALCCMSWPLSDSCVDLMLCTGCSCTQSVPAVCMVCKEAAFAEPGQQGSDSSDCCLV